MDPVTQFAWGALLLLGGAVGAWLAPDVARFSEQLDAVGSTTSVETVEPATWKVLLFRLAAAGVGLFGLWLVATGVHTVLFV